MNAAWLHAVTIICHTLVLICLIICAALLATSNQLNTGTITFLATIGGITSGGLVINGRKVPQETGDKNE